MSDSDLLPQALARRREPVMGIEYRAKIGHEIGLAERAALLDALASRKEWRVLRRNEASLSVKYADIPLDPSWPEHLSLVVEPSSIYVNFWGTHRELELATINMLRSEIRRLGLLLHPIFEEL